MHCVHRNPAVPPTSTARWSCRTRWSTRSTSPASCSTRRSRRSRSSSPPPIPVRPKVSPTRRSPSCETASGKHVDVELFVTTGVAYEVRTEVVGREGQRHDRTRRRAGAQERTGTLGRPDHAGLPRALRRRPTTPRSSAGSTPCAPASTSTDRRLGRLRRGSGVRGGRRVAENGGLPVDVKIVDRASIKGA